MSGMLSVLQIVVGLLSCTSSLGTRTGGWEEVKEVDDSMKEDFYLAVGRESGYEKMGSEWMICATDFESVKYQVVAGMKYEFRVMGCVVDAVDKTFKGCGDSHCGDIEKFEVAIYTQSWNDIATITKMNKVARYDDDEL